MKYLITGATGLLGSAFARALGPTAVSLGRSDLDVRDPKRLIGLVGQSGASILVNCAANVDADGSETAPAAAYEANTALPALLATSCRIANVRLIHFSSTGCYGNWKDGPYNDDDPIHPTTEHHRSKAAGEWCIRASGVDHVILRTGWLFGGGPENCRNFVWQRLKEAATTPVMASDTSQRGNPTFVGDVVEQTLAVLQTNFSGTFNCVGVGTASRFEYVSEIIRLSEFSCQLRPTGPFQRAAPVSMNESARNARLDSLGLNTMPPWRESLTRYMALVRKWPEWPPRCQ